MPLFKAYVGPQGDAFELVMAITGSGQERNILSDISIRDRFTSEEAISFNRETLVYSPTDNLITGGVLKLTISPAEAALITPLNGYTNTIDGIQYFFLRGEQVLIRDYTNSNPVSSTENANATTSTVSVGEGVYEVAVTDASALTDSREESVAIENGRAASISGPAEVNPEEDISFTITTAKQSALSNFTAVRWTLQFGSGTPIDITSGLTGAGSSDPDGINTLLAGGSVTWTGGSNVSLETRTTTIEFDYDDNGTTRTISDTLIVPVANQPPTVTISTTSSDTVNSGNTIEFSADVQPVTERTGGTYIWFVDGFRRVTNDDPNNVFELTQTEPGTHTIQCIFFDSFGLSGESNIITRTWQST